MMNARTLFLLAPLALALSACSSDDDRDFDAVEAARDEARAANPAPVALFNPSTGALPSATDLAFQGSEDGTLNAPVPGDDDSLSNPRVAVNLADGFSTVSPISTPLNNALDTASLRIGETVRVFELDASGETPVLGDELDGTAIVATASGDADGGYRLVLVPTRPLSPATRHAVYLTSGITDLGGRALGADSTFRLTRAGTPLVGDPDLEAALQDFNPLLRGPEGNERAPLLQLEGLRQITRPLIELVQTASEPPPVQNIALAWTFTTQGITEVLQAVDDATTPRQLVVQRAPGELTTANTRGLGAADLYGGTLDLPYYQIPVIDNSASGGEAPSAPEFLAATNGFWVPASGMGEVVTRFDPAPRERGVQTVPVLMSVPNANAGQAQPDAGWPVAIFQHGITRNRADMLAVADSMAAAGFAVVAIDQPLHGILERDTDLAPLRIPGLERHFEIDLATEDEANNLLSFGPDGSPDSSGRHFYNPQNLVNSRDNLRQAVSDLLTLSASLEGMVLAGADGTFAPFPLDTGRKAFVGHSLGAIVGTTFLAFDETVQSATLGMPGGGISQLLANSAAFGPTLLGGVAPTIMAANDGVFVPADYQAFLGAAQTLVDAGDPINHAAAVAARGIPVHLIEVVGEPGVSLPDLVIPNAVAGAPLAGTEPLARELGLQPIVESATNGALVRFSRGTHGSILDPTSDPSPDGVDLTEAEGATGLAVTSEMQAQTATFAASVGTSLPIANADVIAPLDVEIQEATLPALPMPEAADPAGARP